MHHELTLDDEDRLMKAREWVKGHFTEGADQKYEPVEGKLRVIDAILSNGWLRRDQTWELQALGVAFGDALVQELMLEWVSVEDEYGSDPALNWPGTSILCYPLTMISKRVERGESVDVRELLTNTAQTLNEAAFSGRWE